MKQREVKEEKDDGKKENVDQSQLPIWEIGGDLEIAATTGKAIVIVNDAETDDGRGVVQILKALSHIISVKAVGNPVNVAMVVGDGDPLIRLNIIKTLVECMRADGYLSDNIKITYILGQNGTGDGDHPVYESMMRQEISLTEGMEEGISLTQFMEAYGDNGSLVYGLKESQELMNCFGTNPQIFANSDLYTYVGGHNYKPTHGSVIELLDSFTSVKGFSNFVALQGKDGAKPRDITLENTPKFSSLMLDSESSTVKFLKAMTVAWNSETIFKLCEKKLLQEADKLAKKDQEKLDKAISEKKSEKVIEAIESESATHKMAIKNLQEKINTIREADGKINLQKMTVEFIKTLAPDLAMLPQTFPFGMWANVAAEPELQSVIADDLPALASFINGLASYENGHSHFTGNFLGVDVDTKGNLSFATNIAHQDIGELDNLESYIFSEDFPSRFEEPLLAGEEAFVLDLD